MPVDLPVECDIDPDHTIVNDPEKAIKISPCENKHIYIWNDMTVKCIPRELVANYLKEETK